MWFLFPLISITHLYNQKTSNVWSFIFCTDLFIGYRFDVSNRSLLIQDGYYEPGIIPNSINTVLEALDLKVIKPLREHINSIPPIVDKDKSDDFIQQVIQEKWIGKTFNTSIISNGFSIMLSNFNYSNPLFYIFEFTSLSNANDQPKLIDNSIVKAEYSTDPWKESRIKWHYGKISSGMRGAVGCRIGNSIGIYLGAHSPFFSVIAADLTLEFKDNDNKIQRIKAHSLGGESILHVGIFIPIWNRIILDLWAGRSSSAHDNYEIRADFIGGFKGSTYKQSNSFGLNLYVKLSKN